MKKIVHKILFSILLTSSLLVLILVGYNILNVIRYHDSEIAHFQKSLLADYDQLVKNEVETALSLINHIYQQYLDGVLTEEEAQTQSLRLVKQLRYGETGYFWVDDLNHNLIAHPMIPEEEGSNRFDLTDPNGVKLIQNIVTGVESSLLTNCRKTLLEKLIK